MFFTDLYILNALKTVRFRRHLQLAALMNRSSGGLKKALIERLKRSLASARHKKVLKQAKGYYGARSRVYRVAKQAVIKAAQYAFRDRRQKKRQFRALWIVRINAAAKNLGMSYSRFMHGLKLANIDMDRKVLASIAMDDPKTFESISLIFFSTFIIRFADLL